MNACILNVTTDEYDQILQLNHDSVVWNNGDELLLHGLEALIGKDLVANIRKYDECRMLKHYSLDRLARVVEDQTDADSGDRPIPIDLLGENATHELAGCPTGLSSDFSGIEKPENHQPLEVEHLEGRQGSSDDQ